MFELKTRAAVQAAASEGTVFIEFFASWCPSCKQLIPFLEQLEEDFEDVHFYKFNVGRDAVFVDSLDIVSVPTALIYRDGTIFEAITGKAHATVYAETLQRALR